MTILREDFEGAFPGAWRLVDAHLTRPSEYVWAKRTCRPYAQSTNSGWAIGGGADGASLACGNEYISEANSWMIHGPFSLAGATAAELSAMGWRQLEDIFDAVSLLASIDSQHYNGIQFPGSSQGWQEMRLDLGAVPNLGNLAGQPSVWIAIQFETDVSLAYAEGAYVDDIVLRKCTSPGCTPVYPASLDSGPKSLAIPIARSIMGPQDAPRD